MTDAFAELVMPVFRDVIKLQYRLVQDETRSLEQVKQLTGTLLEETRRRAMGHGELARSFEAARYGLVAWIDEVLTDSEWGRRMDYPDHILEWDVYPADTRIRGRAYLFYEKADEAAKRGDLDASAVYLMCVALGFKGVLRNNEGKLADWVERTYEAVSSADAVPSRPFPEDPPRKQVFGPLRGPSLLLTTSVLVSITAVVTLAAYLIAVHLSISKS